MKNNTPSRTAAKVALNLLTLSAKPGRAEWMPPGLVTATEQLLLASGVAGERTLRWAQSKRMVAVYEWFDWMLPGQFEAFAHRKTFCERQVRAGIGAGATQILVLGAGYDTLGWRLSARFPDVDFFEIDHPPTAAAKAKGIKAMGHRDNLFLISEDLGKRHLDEVLGAHPAWNRSVQSVVVAEGLLMYLAPGSVQELLTRGAHAVGKGSRLVFSYIPSGPDGLPYVGRWTGLMLWIQNMTGEPWLWSIRPEKLAGFLTQTGWREAPEIGNSNGLCGVEYLGAALKDD